MNTFTVEKFAKMTGVDRAKAYGFLAFLQETGLINSTPGAKTGKKGKPSRVFQVTEDTWNSLLNFLINLQEPVMDESSVVESEPEHEFVGGDFEDVIADQMSALAAE